MKKTVPILFFLPLLLAACSSGIARVSLQQRLQDPLFAERYWAELNERMQDMYINKDPLLNDKAKKDLVEDTRQKAIVQEHANTELQKQGMKGTFLTVTEATDGEVLLIHNVLYLGTSFATYPGPALHLYLTTIADPRSTPFPDKTALDFGTLDSPYGSQAYPVPDNASAPLYRTVVLWDSKLQRLYGFAQLSKVQ